jgi:hypothetical protein
MPPAGRGSVDATRRTAGERIMNWNIGNVRGRRWVVAGIAAAMAISSGGGLRAQGGSWKDIQGVWLVQVTLRNCDTGAPLGPAFNSMVSFHEGGTLSETTTSGAFAPGQRTPGHGSWETLGHGTYTQRAVSLIAFDTAPNPPVSPGFLAGSSVVTHTVELTDHDHLTSSGTNAFYRTDGTVYRTGCSTAAGTRFE